MNKLFSSHSIDKTLVPTYHSAFICLTLVYHIAT